MHILLLGASGQVGRAVLRSAGADVRFSVPTSAELDLRSAGAARQAVLDIKPDVVINCAAFTRVDDAEESGADDAVALNSVAPGILSGAALEIGARFIHLSTDYVFDGAGLPPYSTSAAVNPLSAYGETKLRGELHTLENNPEALVVRTAWVHSGEGVNFVATAVNLFLKGKVMHVVDDQVSTPTRALHLANALWLFLANPGLKGRYHFTDAGAASWYDVAQCVLETLQRDGIREPGTAVIPVPTTAFPRPARRPRVSLLDKHATWESLKLTPQHWRVGVAASARELANA
ncbi:MAG: dTDP-4-dehydrorhamnose reductase [Phycisphaerae bacterium]|nr:dTDP-4-dehydrorhamnose reductase [Gemmatimonadaceae bacterium]